MLHRRLQSRPIIAEMPLNLMDAHFRSFAHLVLPYLIKHGIAVLGTKTFGDSMLLKSDALIAPLDYLHYPSISRPSVVITGIENQRNLDQARLSSPRGPSCRWPGRRWRRC